MNSVGARFGAPTGVCATGRRQLRLACSTRLVSLLGNLFLFRSVRIHSAEAPHRSIGSHPPFHAIRSFQAFTPRKLGPVRRLRR